MAIGSDSKTRLLLLARRFPFNHGEVAAESYLENEIGLLSSYFDEVLVVGTEASLGDAPTCTLPKNVTPVALGCGNGPKDKALLSVRGSLFPFGCDDAVREAYASDPVHGLKKRIFRGYFTARAKVKFDFLSKVLEDRNFEPTHIYSFWFYDTALVAAWVNDKYPCARAVARAHRYDLYTDRTCVHYLPFRKYLLSKLAMVLPCSADGERYINDSWPGFEDKVRTAYLGTRELPDKSGETTTLPLRIVSCSRVVDVKRVPLLAEAIALLDAEGFALDWTHYGDGPELDKAKACCSGLSLSVANFAGALPNDALLEEYSARHFDLFVNVSASEGLPLSIMEACGCGIPVLATDVGGTHELVADGVNGYLLPESCDAAGIASSVRRFAALGEDEKSAMRRSARSAWEKGFRLSANVDGFARALIAGSWSKGE